MSYNADIEMAAEKSTKRQPTQKTDGCKVGRPQDALSIAYVRFAMEYVGEFEVLRKQVFDRFAKVQNPKDYY